MPAWARTDLSPEARIPGGRRLGLSERAPGSISAKCGGIYGMGKRGHGIEFEFKKWGKFKGSSESIATLQAGCRSEGPGFAD